jgi:hypothetical protein
MECHGCEGGCPCGPDDAYSTPLSDIHMGLPMQAPFLSRLRQVLEAHDMDNDSDAWRRAGL